jgi:ELWxxDGT repeat protein
VFDPATGKVTRLTRAGVPGVPFPGGTSVTDAMPQNLTVAGDRVFFTAVGPNGVRQVYVTDGTPAGTRVTREFTTGGVFSPTPFPTGPDILAAVGGQVLFAADDGKSGRELWITDGTTTGTRLAKEFAPGAASGLPPTWLAPASAVVLNNKLLLAASAPQTGSEPWAVPLAELGVTPSTTPTPTPTPAPAAGVVRTFAVRGTLRELFKGNLATVTLPEASGYTATVDWGDGKPVAATLARVTPTGKTWTVSAERRLVLAGDSRLSVKVVRAGTVVLGFTVDAGVAEPKFYAVRVAQRVTVGSPFRGAVAVVDDLGKGLTAADLTATIRWGDGTTSTGTLKRTAAGRLEVVGEHTFKAAGKAAVSVTVTAVGGKRVQAADSPFTVDAAKRK